MAHKTERGLFELRQGRALHVATRDGEGSVVVAPVEGLGGEILEQLRTLGGQLRLVITHHRARAMGMVESDVPAVLSLALGADATPLSILRLATAPRNSMVAETSAPPDLRGASGGEAAAMALARVGRLLPALVSVSVAPDNEALGRMLADAAILAVSSEEVEAAVARPGIEVTHVTEASVPLADAEESRFVFFREGAGFLEHVAVLIGSRDEWPDPVPVRLHSACLTGDLFGSLRCDCGEQLHGSLQHFTSQGGGVLVYLAQEGRGIGLGNKIRAYTLQETGFDTIDADGNLGFGADERSYDAAVAILRHLGIERVRLLTNNPDKVRAVEEGGIQVVERMPIHGLLNPHNLPYVQAKVHRSGHWLADMMAQRASGE